MKCYVDSSFDNKRNVAGIGIVIQNGEKQHIYSNWIPCNSNNYGELFAVYLAAILTNGQATIYTDSECALAYLEGRINNERPRTQAQYIEHQNMRVLAYKVNKIKPDVRKVKAHTKQFKFLAIGNAMADLLSKNGRAKFYEFEKTNKKFMLTKKQKSL